ncbi:MAG TPA: AAA family ATPase, partial [Acidobacteriota bacterium]|nr:AAA family ATPase [Acidobacteriota bacterium]
MTRIIKLEMKGFKSFAKQTDILFNDDFNVVIGPNGSGKSNVIDALCFVLGKSSAKGLRAEKSANLIYNGGKLKQPMKEGEVSIYFDNSSKVFPVDAAEIKVTRIIKDNGQSVYKINGKKHTRNEVLDFLYYAKINPDGYNIILQGDIIRFVEMSGEDRRRIIEQISDISVYEDKKQKAILELEKVEQSFKEAQIILNERNSYLRDLSKEREQALAFKDLDVAVKRGRATILSKTMGDKQGQIDKINEGNASTVKAQQELQTLINELRKEIAEKKSQIAQINTQIESQGDKEQVALHKKLELLKVEVATAKNRIQVISDEITRINTRKTQLQTSRTELQQKIKQLNEQKKHQDISISTNQKMQAQIKANIAEFRKKHNMEQAGEVDKQIEDLDKKIDEQQKEVDRLREQQQDMLRTKDRLELQIKNADEKIMKVLEVSKAHKTEIEGLKQKRLEFKKVTVELSQKLNADASMVAQVSNARSKINFLNEELAKLNARRASIQETLGGSMAIAKIIEQKHKLGGVHGTISSLGSVEGKYAKALEVAAGNKIKAIVVDDDEVAERCINFLKQNQLGVATFLPLNKIKGQAITEKVPSGPGIHGFALDLITFDKKYRNAFSHVFTNTVIVEDIGAARKVGIGSLRMVTIDGDLTESSGAMQGGFRKGTT